MIDVESDLKKRLKDTKVLIRDIEKKLRESRRDLTDQLLKAKSEEAEIMDVLRRLSRN